MIFCNTPVLQFFITTSVETNLSSSFFTAMFSLPYSKSLVMSYMSAFSKPTFSSWLFSLPHCYLLHLDQLVASSNNGSALHLLLCYHCPLLGLEITLIWFHHLPVEEQNCKWHQRHCWQQQYQAADNVLRISCSCYPLDNPVSSE